MVAKREALVYCSGKKGSYFSTEFSTCLLLWGTKHQASPTKSNKLRHLNLDSYFNCICIFTIKLCWSVFVARCFGEQSKHRLWSQINPNLNLNSYFNCPKNMNFVCVLTIKCCRSVFALLKMWCILKGDLYNKGWKARQWKTKHGFHCQW